MQRNSAVFWLVVAGVVVSLLLSFSTRSEVKKISSEREKTDEALMALSGFFDRHFGGEESSAKPPRSKKTKPVKEDDDDEDEPEGGAEHLLRSLELADLHYGKECDKRRDRAEDGPGLGSAFEETEDPLRHVQEAQRHLGVVESLLEERKD